MRIQEPGHCAPPDTPFILVTKVKGALRLFAVDAGAQALGYAPGMTLADARARDPDLCVAPANEGADRHWLNQLTRHCQNWSPHVTCAPPDSVLIDISGCAHLFGGEGPMVARVEEDMTDIGMAVRPGLADTAEAAVALARYGDYLAHDEYGAIRTLPVAALGLEKDAEQALCRAGLRTVGAVAARPAASIAARFGIGAVRALDRLLGAEHAPTIPLPQDAPLRFERRFAEPIAHQDSISGVFGDLLQEASRMLMEKAFGGRAFRFTLYRSDGARHRLEVETGQSTRDPALVLRLLNERIGALADPLDPGFGYDKIVLSIPVAEPLKPRQIGLEDDGTDIDAVMELIDRLGTRLGAGTIRRLVPQDSHIPEQAQLALPATHQKPPQAWPEPTPGEPPLRPLILFDPPQLVHVIAEVPDGPPHRFRWKRRLHDVRLYEGPERIAAEWWRRTFGEVPGQGGLTRDYYRIEDMRGRRYWLFRHGLYEEKAQPKWYLHGLFA